MTMTLVEMEHETPLAFIREQNKKCSFKFLKMLQAVHGHEPPEPIVAEKPAPPLLPIPNEKIAAAAEVAFPEWAGAIKRIQIAVCAEYGITSVDLCSHRRHQRVVRPRQVAMYLCKMLTDRSLPEIGRRFGQRDHTTVIASIRRIETICASDPDFRSRIEKVANSVGAELV